uniref:3'-5' exonuclease domain-containing protein n=2 Tax=Anopheles atroparvus TaxID=41427 RepID=A0AAG5DGK1_ANOAO
MNNTDLEVGQTLLLELEEECVVGELRNLSSGRTFIQLSKVRDLATNLQRGIQYYYSSEVRKIQILKQPTEPSYSRLSNSASDGSAQTQSRAVLTTKQLSFHYLDAALEKIQKCVFIQQTDAKYYDAIKYLQNQREFGVFMERIEDGRHSKSPSLLSFVTFRWIFIFDIKWMKITKDVGAFLSGDSHRRVIHNGRILKDVLQHCYGIVLGRCFDIMVAFIANSKAEGKIVDDPVINSEYSIQHCVEKYLKLPAKFFSVDVDFDERPLKNEGKLEAAKKVAFLLDMQNHIVHEIMFERFYGSCKMYADSLAQHVKRNNQNEAL